MGGNEGHDPSHGFDQLHQVESFGLRSASALGRSHAALAKRGTIMKEATLRVFRGDSKGGQTVDYRVPVPPGMVVLDALHYIQGHLAQELAGRLNCKAGKCGSCASVAHDSPRLR